MRIDHSIHMSISMVEKIKNITQDYFEPVII
jgi:hypothetical protein